MNLDPSLASDPCVLAAAAGSFAISFHFPVAMSNTWQRRVSGSRPGPLV
jgi:hypothetical protein